jgi:processive 1,2-diacylglycerol beta-glucosyltransferase
MVEDVSAHITYNGRRLSTGISGLYDWSLKMNARPYRALYDLADNHPERISRVAQRIFGIRTTRWLEEISPDVIVSTYPLVSFVVSQLFREKPVGVVSVVTDVGRVTQLWWSGGRDAHMNLVMDTDVAGHAHDHGIPAHRVRNVGLIVDPPAEVGLSEPPITKRDDDSFRLLLNAGGQGYGPNLVRFAETMARTDTGPLLHYYLAVGTNEKLAARLQTVLSPARVTVCPREGMSALLSDVDLVVGKAGWATLTECIVARKPVIITDQIPGQEHYNAEFAEKVGVAQVLRVDDAVRRVERYAADPATMAIDFRDRADLRAPDLPDRLKLAVDSVLRGATGTASRSR